MNNAKELKLIKYSKFFPQRCVEGILVCDVIVDLLVVYVDNS